VPAAAVIPAPIAYIKVVAVKKLVVGSVSGRCRTTLAARLAAAGPRARGTTSLARARPSPPPSAALGVSHRHVGRTYCRQADTCPRRRRTGRGPAPPSGPAAAPREAAAYSNLAARCS
jgi:hypothetical protein